MKKTTLIFASLVTTLLLCSCGSTKNLQTTPDEYETEPVTLPTEEDEGTSVKTNKKSNQTKKKSGKTVSDALTDLVTFTNNSKYLRFDETNLFTPELTGLKERTAQVLIRREDGSAGFGSYYMAAYYIVQFDDEARAKLTKAVENYLSDFENKRLQRKGKRTERTYGKVAYRLDWGTAASVTPNHGTGEGYLGYEFIKNSPYFCINNYPFENDYYERAGESTNRESMSIRFYFTRSQARQLIELLSDESIASQITGTSINQAPTEADEY